jgi:hypothetical protein
MGRITIYSIAWMTVIAIILLVRFLAFSGTSGGERGPLAVTYVVLVFLFLSITDSYERRRLLVRSGRSSRGTFGFLRDWVKPAGVDLALGTLEKHSPAERELVMFNRFSVVLFASMYLLVPLLVF